MDAAHVLDLLDRELRQAGDASVPGTVERVGDVVRFASDDPDGWAAVTWSDLDGADVERAVADAVAWFRSLGRPCEWKHYAHDRPASLPRHLEAAGLVPDEPEALMVAEVGALSTDVVLPDGLRIEAVVDADGVAKVVEVNERVFGGDQQRHGRALLRQLETSPDAVRVLVVLDGDRPVCSARLELHPGTSFASLWGGGTVPEWRGRGVYRATVAHRAGQAAAAGHRYLRVDASPMSEPVLRRLGFIRLTTTTPYALPG